MARSEDRERQVETTKRRYGPDYYSKIGSMRGSTRIQAKFASWRRWHPERFDNNGEIMAEWRDIFYAHNH